MSPKIVRDYMKLIKSVKDDGKYGFMFDHLDNLVALRFHVLFSLLFDNMLTHGLYSLNLLQSTIISFIKSINDKIFDYVLLRMLAASDMQFAYKESYSTTSCEYMNLLYAITHFPCIVSYTNVYFP